MMGFDGLRRAEPQELRPKTAHGANTSRSEGGGSHIKEVEINEDSLISVLKRHLSKKPNQGIQENFHKLNI